MNKQGRLINGKVVGGIEWTKTVLPDGTERQGFTLNVMGGCLHQCRWQMPNGNIAICYAESVAQRVAQAAYPHGFEFHYWHQDRLAEPARLKQSSRIFVDSMADLFGAWVPEDQIRAMFDMMRAAPWHTFQSLTKNAPRLLKYIADFPPNLWVGVSMPPDYFKGHLLTPGQKAAMLRKSLFVLEDIARARPELITWMSFEPVSWDVSDMLCYFPHALRWAVIGAASDGARYIQPDHDHVDDLHFVLHMQGVPVLHKGNLKWQPHREEFPQVREAA